MSIDYILRGFEGGPRSRYDTIRNYRDLDSADPLVPSYTLIRWIEAIKVCSGLLVFYYPLVHKCDSSVEYVQLRHNAMDSRQN